MSVIYYHYKLNLLTCVSYTNLLGEAGSTNQDVSDLCPCLCRSSSRVESSVLLTAWTALFISLGNNYIFFKKEEWVFLADVHIQFVIPKCIHGIYS